MTSAPQSASWRTQVGPARTRVRSSTLKRASASLAGRRDIVCSWRNAARGGSHDRGHLAGVELEPGGFADAVYFERRRGHAQFGRTLGRHDDVIPIFAQIGALDDLDFDLRSIAGTLGTCAGEPHALRPHREGDLS